MTSCHVRRGSKAMALGLRDFWDKLSVRLLIESTKSKLLITPTTSNKPASTIYWAQTTTRYVQFSRQGPRAMYICTQTANWLGRYRVAFRRQPRMKSNTTQSSRYPLRMGNCSFNWSIVKKGKFSNDECEVYLDADCREFLGILFIKWEPSFQSAIDLSSYTGLQKWGSVWWELHNYRRTWTFW